MSFINPDLMGGFARKRTPSKGVARALPFRPSQARPLPLRPGQGRMPFDPGIIERARPLPKLFPKSAPGLDKGKLIDWITAKTRPAPVGGMGMGGALGNPWMGGGGSMGDVQSMEHVGPSYGPFTPAPNAQPGLDWRFQMPGNDPYQSDQMGGGGGPDGMPQTRGWDQGANPQAISDRLRQLILHMQGLSWGGGSGPY